MTVMPVTAKSDARASGFRYYEPAPYVMVYSTGTGDLTSSIVYLPDLSRKMAAQPYAYFAANTTKLNFSNGIMAESSIDADASAVPKAIVDAVKTAAVAAAKGGFNIPRGAERLDNSFAAPAPRLFKVVFKDGQVFLLGDEPNPTRVNVTLPL